MSGLFPRPDALDPTRLAATIVAVLAEYPETVIHAVTDPVRGLPSQVKWFPTVYEVRQACEALVRPQREMSALRHSPYPTLNREKRVKATIGSEEHKRVVEGFRSLTEILAASPTKL